MTIDYDHQILESVAVRRTRLTNALLFGSERTRRSFDDGLKFLLISAILATIICAGCVGYSFIVDLMEQSDRSLQGPLSMVMIP
ncbi:hypothetical protein [Nesterenkonia sp. F]|uniref:hypothetical protein n=1 Tax=Nesterenkonia sp. F TaxID=795955 RepID=UPI000255C89B|nr:hypothetical protein [Nesterenkonia sp. F]